LLLEIFDDGAGAAVQTLGGGVVHSVKSGPDHLARSDSHQEDVASGARGWSFGRRLLHHSARRLFLLLGSGLAGGEDVLHGLAEGRIYALAEHGIGLLGVHHDGKDAFGGEALGEILVEAPRHGHQIDFVDVRQTHGGGGGERQRRRQNQYNQGSHWYE